MSDRGEPERAEGFDPLAFTRIAGSMGHGGALGITYEGHGADWAELSLPYDEKLVGVAATGVLASGPIVSLMDMASSLAIWIRIGHFRPQATLDLRVDYLRPAVPGRKIIARCECYGVTRSVGFTRGLAHDGDPADPLAHATATFMVTG